MRRNLIAAVILLASSGCQQAQVRKHSALLSREVPDLYYQQILDNVAMAIATGDNLAYFGLPVQGTSTNTRQASAGFTPTWSFITPAGYFFSRWLLASQAAPLSGSNQNQSAFQVTPVSDPDRLELLRAVFAAAAHRINTTDPANKTFQTYKLLQSYYWSRSNKSPYVDYSLGVFKPDPLPGTAASAAGMPDAPSEEVPAPEASSSSTNPHRISSVALVSGVERDDDNGAGGFINRGSDTDTVPLPAMPGRADSRPVDEHGSDKPVESGSNDRAHNPAAVPATLPATVNVRGTFSGVATVSQPAPAPAPVPTPDPYPPQYELKEFWLGVATDKHSVPKDACYVGRYCDTYVWVLPGSTEDLRLLTMAVLDITSIDLDGLKFHKATSSGASAAAHQYKGSTKPNGAFNGEPTLEPEFPEIYRNQRIQPGMPYSPPPNAPSIGP